jgi:hypothetical protein
MTRAVGGAATVRGVRLAGIDAADRARRSLLAAEMERAPQERHGVYRRPSGPLASRANALVVVREPLLGRASGHLDSSKQVEHAFSLVDESIQKLYLKRFIRCSRLKRCPKERDLASASATSRLVPASR